VELESLIHLVGRVQAIAPNHRIILFGSSSLFASFPGDPPARLGVEVTIDADFLIDPDDAVLRDQLQQSLGKDNEFHDATGFYGDFVDLRLSENFPSGWRDRLVPMSGFDRVFAIDPVDMAATKIAATAGARLSIRMGRGGVDRGMKDISIVSALLRAGRIDGDAIEKRMDQMNHQPAMIVESARVMDEIRERVRAGTSDDGVG
jgi:hypothetical protein